eukprot:jgi/Chrzof1/5177/Cz15g15010.t1
MCDTLQGCIFFVGWRANFTAVVGNAQSYFPSHGVLLGQAKTVRLLYRTYQHTVDSIYIPMAEGQYWEGIDGNLLSKSF